MAGPGTLVYLSRLAGVGVFDPNGDSVGRVRDAVGRVRSDGHTIVVHGLVVEVPVRRRIFLPLTRVTGLSPRQVIATGLMNMQRFEPRAGELLVLDSLVDRRVAVRGEAGAVVDVGMEQDRTREWTVTHLYVRDTSHTLRRRGHTRVVAVDEVTGLTDPGASHDTEETVARLVELRAADAARVLHELPPARRLAVAAQLDDEVLADVLEELGESTQVQLLAALAPERAADVLEAMSPDDAADLLGELPPAQAETLMRLMDPDDAADMRRLLSYGEDTAGGLMTTEPVILPADATVADALARVRSPDLSPALASQVYLVRPPMETPTGRFVGLVHLQRLLREPPSTLASAACDTDLSPLPPETPLSAVSAYLAMYNLLAMPVVDATGRLLGAVSVDDVLDHLLPEQWREDAHQEVGRNGSGTE